MAVDDDAIETYNNKSMIREDLQQQYTMISPEEVPFQTSIGTGTPATSTYHEWPIVDLAAPDSTNRVIEGDEAPAVDVGTLGIRLGNYTQISDKKVIVTQTSEAVEAAAENIQKIAKQTAIKIRELKRDMETMLLQNIAADAGSSGAARQSAGFPAFLRTNTIAGVGGTDPTLSGTTDGYPDAAAGVGTVVPLTEDDFNDVITLAWEEGGNPTIAMVNSNNKRVISSTFTGSSTRYKDAIDKTLVNAIDVYDSDFGEFSIVPNRFQPLIDTASYAVYILDPDLASVDFLETVRQKPLAETGHSKSRLVWCEYTLKVDNEAGHGVIRDTNGAAV